MDKLRNVGKQSGESVESVLNVGLCTTALSQCHIQVGWVKVVDL